jgi:DNA-directed RNA polymerase specialized sigma24 family protein
MRGQPTYSGEAGGNNMEKTDAEVKAAYNVARRIAKSVMRSRTTAGMAYEDFVQEGVLAWLQGRSIYYGMIDAFRRLAPISPYSYGVKGVKEPEMVSFVEELYTQYDDDERDRIDTLLDAEKILKRIQEIPNDVLQFALLGYLYFGMTLREIGSVLEKSHEWVRTYLVEPELKKIREEFQC